LDLKALRYFVTITQFGSITKAAAHLRVAQPALSRQVKKLETELGVQLLHRMAQGVRLTDPGKRLTESASRILHLMDKTRAEAKSWGDNPAGPVSVALMPSAGSMIAPSLVRKVRQRLPDVRLILSEGLTSYINEGLLNESFDLGIYHSGRNDPAFSARLLLSEPMFLVGSAAPDQPGPNDPMRLVSFKDLSSYPLLLPSRPNSLRLMIDRLASAHKIKLDIRETVNSASIIKHLVKAGLGYTIQSYSYVFEEVERGDLALWRLDIEGLSRDWSLACVLDRPQTPAAIAVGRIIEEIAAGLATVRQWQTP